MAGEVFDVAVVGAGPAGATAANILARKQRKVVLIDGATFPRRAPSLGWVNRRIGPMLADLGVPTADLLAHPFRDLTLHNADFTKSATPKFDEAAGYLVNRTALGNALQQSAVAHEVTFIDGAKVDDVGLREDRVVLQFNGAEPVESRLLILASGRDAGLFDRAGFTREGGASAMWTAQIDVPIGPGGNTASPQMDLVFGLDKGGSFGLFAVADDRLCATVNWIGEASDATAAFVKMCAGARDHSVIPVDLTREAREAPVTLSPASIALDMDTHVGKHSLVIGDAGGFVAAVSNEGVYPAMWSARIAADVIDTALDSKHSQDELMAFDSQWRMEMADYLRAPNTDSQFLLPLIFSNQPMADRMGAAFFSGENI